MNHRDRIVRDPLVCGGEPVIKGTRVTLRTLLASLSDGDELVPFSADARGVLEPLVCGSCGSGKLGLSYEGRCSRCEHRLASDD
ncbi:DUF433 domain-containing protein [Sorangium sp. So ce854]|uniref:DUF433 domain-containing protein n=1 Tax=Sorangium sp. So ce854 TaxID=3133322 RepID=UPI003F5F6277